MPRKIEKFVPGGGRVYAKLANDVARTLVQALAQEEKHTGLTKARLADLVGRDKAFVTRSMSGTGNLTLRTIAALMAAMGYEMEVSAHRIDAVPDKPSNGPPRNTASISILNPPRIPATASTVSDSGKMKLVGAYTRE